MAVEQVQAQLQVMRPHPAGESLRCGDLGTFSTSSWPTCTYADACRRPASAHRLPTTPVTEVSSAVRGRSGTRTPTYLSYLVFLQLAWLMCASW
uniref:Predicted protein n=1 Tax=Hordeum vulgare subsp. vulgare TaxID=112509 RepID=F2D879_HORVV|nr:predicted protein [Hordeum vulgare subsp. vulgare]